MKSISLLLVALLGFIGLAHAEFDPSYHDGFKRPKEIEKSLPSEAVEQLLTQEKSIKFESTDHDGFMRPKKDQ